jgi:anti-sigma B factor antagonist
VKIEVREELKKGAVLSLEGDLLGGPDAEFFYKTLGDLIDRGMTFVLVDLSGIRRANSSGLGILAQGYVVLKRAGGSLRVFNLSKTIAHMFTRTRFNSVIDVFETEEKARASVA